MEMVAYRFQYGKGNVQHSHLLYYVTSIIQEGIDNCIVAVIFLIFILCVPILGGEGIILRKVGSPYERGRSSNLLKVKVGCFAELCSYWITTLGKTKR